MMSGTSADSIDVAVCTIRGSGLKSAVVLDSFLSAALDPRVAAQVQRAPNLSTREIAELDVAVAACFAGAFLQCAAGCPNSVDLIGSHGQTIYHHSRKEGARKASFQVGNGDILAVQTGLPVVSDFRVKDIALGGEGAPLTPYADAVLYGSSGKRAILNLGGIANLTVPANDLSAIIGFDTGPANAPLDRLARKLTAGAQSFDTDGRIARAGNVNEELLRALLDSDPYLKLAPPKSSGFEHYGDDFVAHAERLYGRCDSNLMATLVAFVAQSVADAITRFVPADRRPSELIVAGGGAKNPALMHELAARLAPIAVIVSDEAGVPAAAREAMAFAVLANDALFGLPTSLPGVTGAERAACLGMWSFP